MVIAGIDLATTTGFAVLTGSDLTTFGTIQISDPCTDVRQLVGLLAAFHVDHAAVENVYCGPNVATAIMLATLRGRLLQELDRAGIAWTLVAPSTWRKSTFKPPAKTKRAALKALAQAWVQSTYAVAVSNDEADAVGLAAHLSQSIAQSEKKAE